MRDHDHHGSGQDGVKHADAGQTGHETGHGSLRGRLRRVLSDGLKGLAHGVLADDDECAHVKPSGPNNDSKWRVMGWPDGCVLCVHGDGPTEVEALADALLRAPRRKGEG